MSKNRPDKEKTRQTLNLPGFWSWRTESNPRPADYKSAALPAELRQHYLTLFEGLPPFTQLFNNSLPEIV